MSISPNDTVCQFSPVTLTATPTWGGDNPSFSWLVNDTVRGSGNSYTFVPVDGDEVRLRMNSDYRCRTATTVESGDLSIAVDSMRIPTVTVIPEPGFVVQAGKPVMVRAIPENEGPTPKYQWFVNGFPVAGATSQTYTGIFNDYDSITCQVTSSGVCANIGTSKWVFITVVPLETQQPTAMMSELRLMPNPTRGTFTVKGNVGQTTEEVTAEVTNMLGQVVYTGTTPTRMGQLDAKVTLDKSLPNGMYILTIKTPTEQRTFHFVLEQ
jgi:hypothetical protein